MYEVKHTRYPANRPFKVQLITDPDGHHTHIFTLKEAIDLANYAKYKEVPPDAKIDYLCSLYRLAINPKFKSAIDSAIKNKGGDNPYA
jgi:hypothetical protein